MIHFNGSSSNSLFSSTILQTENAILPSNHKSELKSKKKEQNRSSDLIPYWKTVNWNVRAIRWIFRRASVAYTDRKMKEGQLPLTPQLPFAALRKQWGLNEWRKRNKMHKKLWMKHTFQEMAEIYGCLKPERERERNGVTVTVKGIGGEKSRFYFIIKLKKLR